LFLFNISCQKVPFEKEAESANKEIITWGNIKVPDNFFKTTAIPGVASGTSVNTNTPDSGSPDMNNGDDPIILGQQLNNPYTIANMQQAYLLLYGSTTPVPVTHLYVRLRPSNPDQLEQLIDDTTLELQDYPMDYQVLQDGDYYQDPSLGVEDIGWLYTVVLPGYAPPSGIQYEILQQLHIPPNDDLLLESMAESLVGGASYEDTVFYDYRYINRTDTLSDTLIVPNRLPLPCELDPCAAGCPMWGTPECGGGGGGGTTYNPQIPRGQIRVQDIRTCNNPSTISNVPLRQARIVCKRWFKIWKGYTNDQGLFTAGRKFKNKAKVIVKTENNNARTGKVRGTRVWQILFPVKKRIGVFDQVAMANVNYIFTKPAPTGAYDKGLAEWVAATTHNSVLEFGQYAQENGININLPPSRLNIIVTNWGFQRGAGAAPMWKKCNYTGSDLTPIQAFVHYFIVEPAIIASGTGLLVQALKNRLDVIVGYAANNADYECRLTSANIKEIAYHELGHASHYSQVGCDFWQVYRTRISNELSFGNPVTRPYGNGTETNAGIVAIGEMWGNHIGYTFTNRHYGNGGVFGNFPTGFTARMQGIDWGNEPGGLNCYLRAIENFDPNFYSEIFSPWPWIPEGICYDLFDSSFEIFPIIDNVSGYTISQCFSALQSDIRTVSDFKNRLLQLNNNNQQFQVNALFDEYNY
jgi:hypothetical protein